MGRRDMRTWDAFHRRGEVLRAVVEHADAHRDGALPLEIPGVAETFADAADLVGTLQLRWHTRLTGCIERALLDTPGEPEAAVVAGWRAAASDLAGVRRLLDAQADVPADPAVAGVVEQSRAKDWQLMAGLAGVAGPDEAAALAAGRTLEQQARAGFALPVPPSRRRAESSRERLIGRIRAVLAA